MHLVAAALCTALPACSCGQPVCVSLVRYPGVQGPRPEHQVRALASSPSARVATPSHVGVRRVSRRRGCGTQRPTAAAAKRRRSQPAPLPPRPTCATCRISKPKASFDCAVWSEQDDTTADRTKRVSPGCVAAARMRALAVARPPAGPSLPLPCALASLPQKAKRSALAHLRNEMSRVSADPLKPQCAACELAGRAAGTGGLAARECAGRRKACEAHTASGTRPTSQPKCCTTTMIAKWCGQQAGGSTAGRAGGTAAVRAPGRRPQVPTASDRRPQVVPCALNKAALRNAAKSGRRAPGRELSAVRPCCTTCGAAGRSLACRRRAFLPAYLPGAFDAHDPAEAHAAAAAMRSPPITLRARWRRHATRVCRPPRGTTRPCCWPAVSALVLPVLPIGAAAKCGLQG